MVVKNPDCKRYLAVATAFVLALMSKPVAVTLPIMLLLLDAWPLQRYADQPSVVRWKRFGLEKLTLLLISLGVRLSRS